MEVIPLGPGEPGIETLLEDYRRRAGLPEVLVLSALTEALTSRQARVLVAVEGDAPVGVVVFSRQEQEGRIHLLYALPIHPAALPLLLEHAEAELARSGALRTLSATLPLLPETNLEAVFRARGYRVGVRARMCLTLAGQALAPEPPPGYRLIPWEAGHQEEAVALLAQARTDAWLYPEFSGRAGARRLLEGAVSGRFGRFEARLSTMALAGERLVGLSLALWHPVLPQEGFLLDLYVAPPHRRLGLGRALVLATAEAFREAGAARLGLSVTLSNLPAVRLYQSLGFQVEHRFAVFRRDLASTSARPRRRP